MNYLDSFETYIQKNKEVSKATVSAYRSDVSEYEDFVRTRSKELQDGNNEDVLAFLSKIKSEGKSGATINRKLASIRQFYNYLRELNVIDYDPTIGIHSPKQERKKLEYLTIREVEKLLDAPDSSYTGLRDKALFELMYATGLRASEICEANVRDIDLRIGSISVKSSGKARMVPIGRPARAALQVYLDQSRLHLLGSKEDSKALFLSYLGDRLTRQGIWKILKSYGPKTGLEDKLNPQVLRNSFAAHMIQNGADLKSLQDLLGHLDINATKIYLSVTKNRIMDVYDKTHPRA